MRYISLFSGIEAASVAWEELGWKPIVFSEIEPFPCELLRQRYPDVPNLGDITKIDWKPYAGSVDIIVGGSPCQSFSIAGNREGLAGESGLMFEYIRAVREVRPRYFIWENVPGALSSEKGRAFEQLLTEMDELGYGLAWRILDAQFFGVPQRRRRLFLVGCFGDPERAFEVLFERESLCWDNPSSREKRESLTADAESRSGISCMNPWDVQSKRVYPLDSISPTLPSGTSEGINIQPIVCLPYNPRQITSRQNGSNPQWGDPCHTLAATDYAPHICVGFSAGQSAKAGSIAAQDEVAPTLRASKSGTNQIPSIAFTWNQDTGFSYTNEYAPTLRAARCGEPAVCMASGQSNAEIMEECCPTQMARQYKDPPIVCEAVDARSIRLAGNVSGTLQAKESGGFSLNYQNPVLLKSGGGYTVRRLMPVECERLQGFPDGWTDIEFRGKPASDTARYKALGNSMAVPVMKWIGERMNLLHNSQQLNTVLSRGDKS